MTSIQRLVSLMAGVLLAGSLVLTQTGCVAVAAAGAAAGGVGYANGDLEGYINSSLAKVVASGNNALTRLKYIKIKEETDLNSATITARTDSDTRITIKMNQVTETTCEVSIRFGFFGDQQLSQVLITEIRKGI